MITHWRTIDAWLQSHAPDVFAGLNPPASQQQIIHAEATLGIKFPTEVLSTFRIHNGQRYDSPWLFEGWEFLSLERVVDEWQIWKGLVDCGDFNDMRSESSDLTVQDWWNPLWIPLTYDGCGNHDSLDLNPGPNGRRGQIIKMWHDDSERPLVAPSYAEWIAGFAADLERGRCPFGDKYNDDVMGDE